jgi:hypothetical protein
VPNSALGGGLVWTGNLVVQGSILTEDTLADVVRENLLQRANNGVINLWGRS